MNGVPLPFFIVIVTLVLIGFAGNIRFFFGNYKEKSVHKQLLVFLTFLSVRLALGISLTRSSCLRFVGVLNDVSLLAQANLYTLLGVEAIILVSNASLYRKLQAWWFVAVITSSTLIHSGWSTYVSWTPDDDWPVTVCISPMAMVKRVQDARRICRIVNNCTIIALYLFLLGVLISRKKGAQSSYNVKIIQSSIILMAVFSCTWFVCGIMLSYAAPIGQLLGVPPSQIYLFSCIPTQINIGQTHYVYFFISAENRKAFRWKGPWALFMSKAKLEAKSVSTVSIGPKVSAVAANRRNTTV